MEEIKVLQLFATSKTGVYTPYGEESTISAISIFAIGFVTRGEYPQKLRILAINEGREEYIDLIYMPDHFYRAEVPNIGNFYFVIENPRNVFTRLDGEEVRLSVLTPVNEEFFEQACKEHQFFFVGD